MDYSEEEITSIGNADKYTMPAAFDQGQKVPVIREMLVCTRIRAQLCPPTGTRFKLKRSMVPRWLVILP